MSRNLHRLFAQLAIQKQTTLTSVRLYARWVNRNPAKVILPFEPTSKPNLKKERVITLDPAILNKSKGIQTHKNELRQTAVEISQSEVQASTFTPEKSKKIKTKREETLKKREFYLNQKKVFDDNNNIIYEKLKENDGRVSALLVKLKSKKDRTRTGHILVEGWRMIVDGLEAKCKLKYVIFSRSDDLSNLRPFLPKTGVLFYKVPYMEIELWSDLETSPGIFGVFEMPEAENVKRVCKPLPLHFICDNVRVPGNLGAILRVAVGAGCEKVLLTKGCVDVWDPKVIRSATGAHFRLPIHSAVEWEDMPKLLREGTSVLIADSNAKVICDGDEMEIKDDLESMQMPVVPYYSAQFSNMKHITLIIGGETEGISKDSYELAASKNGLRINIPLQRGIDSLNTGMATAIIAFEIRKQLIEAWTRAKIERQTALAS